MKGEGEKEAARRQGKGRGSGSGRWGSSGVGGAELLKVVTHLPPPSPPWVNYHVQPSGDEITVTLT